MRGSFIDRLLLPAVVGLPQYWLRYLWQRQLTGQRATIRAARKAPSWFVKNKLQSEISGDGGCCGFSLFGLSAIASANSLQRIAQPIAPIDKSIRRAYDSTAFHF